MISEVQTTFKENGYQFPSNSILKAIRFESATWTLESSLSWLKINRKRFSKSDESQSGFISWKQIQSHLIKKAGLERTQIVEVSNGISFVFAY